MGEKKAGCLSCLTTESKIGYYEFQTLSGKRYQAFFCNPCFVTFQNNLGSVDAASKIKVLENLAKMINGKSVYVD